MQKGLSIVVRGRMLAYCSFPVLVCVPRGLICGITETPDTTAAASSPKCSASCLKTACTWLTYRTFFDVYLSGRDTRMCQERLQYWGDEPIDYAYILLAWEGTDARWARQYDASLLRSEGDRETPQSCYLDIYVPTPKQDQ